MAAVYRASLRADFFVADPYFGNSALVDQLTRFVVVNRLRRRTGSLSAWILPWFSPFNFATVSSFVVSAVKI